LYAVLGIKKNASIEDIKKAYRKKVKKCHPDYGGDTEEFRKVQEAYDVLSNEEKKALYDLTGKVPDVNLSLDSQAVEYLACRFQKVFDSLDNKDILTKSVILEVKMQLQEEIKVNEKAIRYEHERANLFSTLKKRIKVKRKKNRNVAREVIEAQIGYSKNGVIKCKQEIKMTKKALELLGQLKMDINIPPDNIVKGFYELVPEEETNFAKNC
jgi:curved DNA-binding protein CbpA